MMAKSLAFWTETNEPTCDCGIDIHFNYWFIPHKNKKAWPTRRNNTIPFLDVGVKISKMHHNNITGIYLYIPFPLNEITFDYSLGNILVDNEDILSALFNKKIIFPESSCPIKYTDIDMESKENRLRIHRNINVISEKFEDGCLLSIKNETLKSILNKTIDSYIRFRIHLNNFNLMHNIFPPDHITLTNYHIHTEIIDFRVNEARNLPKRIRAHIDGKRYFNSIHFFLMIGIKYFSETYTDSVKCRILEIDTWEKYLPKNYEYTIKENIIAYHWKKILKNSSSNSFNVFIKFSNRKVTPLSVVLIIFAVFGINFFSNLFFSSFNFLP